MANRRHLVTLKGQGRDCEQISQKPLDIATVPMEHKYEMA